ncbi:MAG: hypothetical protein H6710_20745 [Myxococcales bacterium]|nr:hypothetical protein [Myxococcales bacterium]MCB9706506.1 hypothetical protein [Myxococcales bacterium]
MSAPTLGGLALTGLRPAPAQAFGAIRLIPLIRDHVPGDIRITTRAYDAATTLVGLEGDADAPTTAYYGYIPHGIVVEWERGGQPVAALGTTLGPRKHLERQARPVQLLHRMVKREDRKRLRLLPLHLALEGYLALHFGGPSVAWSEYSREALRRGLSPRIERVHHGAAIAGLADALRLFEIHEGQVGVLLLVGDALAAATVVPHPDDYRALHRTLLEDLYGELLVHYGLYCDELGELQAPIDPASLGSLAALRQAIAGRRESWRELSELLAAGILDRPLRWQSVYRAGPFHLRRFIGALDPSADNHIGEAITRADGTLEYLKTFRLSAAQVRRAYLLEQLAAAEWSLDRCAEALEISRAALIQRLRGAGFGYLFKAHVC